jgi:hypothetical protein
MLLACEIRLNDSIFFVFSCFESFDQLNLHPKQFHASPPIGLFVDAIASRCATIEQVSALFIQFNVLVVDSQSMLVCVLSAAHSLQQYRGVVLERHDDKDDKHDSDQGTQQLQTTNR